MLVPYGCCSKVRGASADLDIYDVKHRVAVALKHRLEPEPRWREFLSLIGKTRNAAKQTEWAFLLPPVLRTSRVPQPGRVDPLGESDELADRTPAASVVGARCPGRAGRKAGLVAGFRRGSGIVA